MEGEKEDGKKTEDSLVQSLTYDVVSEIEEVDATIVEVEPHDNKSKRKASALANGSPNPETSSITQKEEVTESRSKKQRTKAEGQSSVESKEDKKVEGLEKTYENEKDSDDAKNKQQRPDSTNDEKDGNQKEEEDSDNALKHMEVEKNKNMSIEDNGDKETENSSNTTDKTNTGDSNTDSNENKESQDASATAGNNVTSPEGGPSSSDTNGGADDATGPKSNVKSSNPYDSLKYIMVRNDGKPESLIKLVALKSLFSRQLPKMPRTYIARLVFDRKHISLVILNDDPATKDTDEEVIGSICYRAFPEMRFAEIAFCAVNASHQVKGYGTKLMNLVKKEGARTGIEYFITYADNYAIGYFKKQGFTKNISMPKGRYQGLIKEYDGGTMMECYVHPSIDFTRIPEMLAAQREFILSRIRLKALSHRVVYDPLPKNWKPHLEGISRANESAARALAVPGMIEAGWTMADLMATTGQGKDLDRAKNALKSELIGIVRRVEEQQSSWPFREPVDTNEVKDYLEIIKEPIDLLTIDKRIRKGDHYKSKKMLYADLMLMVNNCKLYNDEASTYVQCAMNVERFLKTLFLSK